MTPEVAKFWAENQPLTQEEAIKGIKEAAPEGEKEAPVTLASLEADIVGCNVCKMLDHGPDRDCGAWRTLNDIRRDRRKEVRALGPPAAEVFRRHVSHAHPVVRLVRTRIGPIADRSLAPGVWRALSVEEIRALEVAVSTDPAERPDA